jgi:DNA-binding response OmpR family regulator
VNDKPLIMLMSDVAFVRDVLFEQLSLHSEWQVINLKDEEEFLTYKNNSPFHLIIKDGELSDKILNNNNFEQSILYISNNNNKNYIQKPFRYFDLIKKIHNILQNKNKIEDEHIIIGPYHFSASLKSLEDRAGLKIRLTEKETDILLFLYRAGEKITSKDVLLQQVWGYNANVTTHTLETHVYRLRQKIEPDPTQVCILVTEAGGYRLMI